MDYKKSKAPHTTLTRDMKELDEKVDNVYESVVIISQRANQIAQDLKKELDERLKDFKEPEKDKKDDPNQEPAEVFENKEQIEISRSYEVLPKPTLMATQELLDDKLTVKIDNKVILKDGEKITPKPDEDEEEDEVQDAQ